VTTNSAESAAIDQLVATQRQLLLDGGRAEVGSEAGYSACAIFLTAVETTAKAMNLEAASRHYRRKFSANYRALFPDDARHYRVDVLEASADQHSAIWVNGDKFELSPEAICHAEALQKAWSELSQLLESCSSDERVKQPARSELSGILNALDTAWASFEFRYITELIEIEEQARRLIIKAVENETKLGSLGDQRGSAEFLQVQAALVQCVAHLNSVANFRRKGRDDLRHDILESAVAVVERSGLTSQTIISAGEGKEFANAAIKEAIGKSAGVSMAIDVVASFEAMRRYLQQVKKCLERVDPHLCNNSGLVARLVDWEESWEVGARYVRQEYLLQATNDIVAEFRLAGRAAPSFTTMCIDCDVELFLVLPRMVILCCLQDPAAPRAGLMQSLLPHRYPALANDGMYSLAEDAELASLLGQFRQVLNLLGTTSGSSSNSSSWKTLVQRAVGGNDNAEDSLRKLPSQVHDHVEALMRAVEGWSLELQRHCAEDWNQCSSVLVQCLNGGSQKQHLQSGGKFQV